MKSIVFLMLGKLCVIIKQSLLFINLKKVKYNQKYKIMLDKKGLTSSEASHIANFIKEQVKNIDVTTSNFKVITQEGRREGNYLRLDSNEEIKNWDDLLLEKGKLFALSAWLKESIKYKEDQIKKIRSSSLDTSTLPKKDVPKPPTKLDTSFEDFFLELSIKEKAEYLLNESKASHIGKFIHNFDGVRNVLDNFKPTEFVNISSTEVMTVRNTMLYDREELLGRIEKLQNIHRECEKVINYYKAKYKEWAAELDTQFQKNWKNYAEEVHMIERENSMILVKARADFEIERTSKLEVLKNLKITIPIEFQPILDEIYKKLK